MAAQEFYYSYELSPSLALFLSFSISLTLPGEMSLLCQYPHTAYRVYEPNIIKQHNLQHFKFKNPEKKNQRLEKKGPLY